VFVRGRNRNEQLNNRQETECLQIKLNVQ
jgi:hypothetical protein